MKFLSGKLSSRSLAGLVLVAGALFVLALVSLSAGSQQAQSTAPGPLSRAHSPLEGAANCQKCHAQGKTVSSAKCLACHQIIGKKMAAKKGVHREVSGDCEACHQEHGGIDVDIRPLDVQNFDHGAETGFALQGKHAALAKDCARCHKTRSYMANKKDCQFCHGDPHQGAMLQNCEACHTPLGWSNVARGFHKGGVFPLEGRHLTVPCASCHLDGMVKGTPNRCYDCHWIRRQDDLYRTRLGSACEECHRPTNWADVRWNHGLNTGMPLNSAHQTLSCEDCHRDQNFQNVTVDCYSCHKEDYQEASDPNHVAAGFPTTCDLCHLPSQSSWNQARLNHSSVYPLMGVHATLDCSACHKNNVYKGTPRDCYGCHRTNYEQTRDPNHVAAGFPTTCELCHRASDPDWHQARIDHNAVYPLLGVHATLDCSACHKNNVYKGTPRDCYGCHRANYEQTRNPNHVAAGFPTTCENCHRASDTSWNQARFDHVWFPITSGRHAGNPCSACHPDSRNYKVFNCLTCHGRAETDSHHGGVSGYNYSSPACYSCHPQGRE